MPIDARHSAGLSGMGDGVSGFSWKPTIRSDPSTCCTPKRPTLYLGSSPTPIDTYTLAAGAALRKNYAGQRDGPMRVTSSATNILTTIRAYVGGVSYSELMGYPSNKLTNEYWYPVYDNVTLDSQLRVSNVGSGTTTITVYLGDNLTPLDSYSLAAGAALRKKCREERRTVACGEQCGADPDDDPVVVHGGRGGELL